jgi:hypothetical protein
MNEEEFEEFVKELDALEQKAWDIHKPNCIPTPGLKVTFKDGSIGIRKENKESEEELEMRKDEIESYEKFTFPCAVCSYFRDYFSAQKRDNMRQRALLEESCEEENERTG